MRRGRHLEPVVISMLREEQPTWTIDYPLHAYYRDPEVRLGATPDAFVRSTEWEGHGVIQVKTTTEKVYRNKWVGRGHDGPAVPEWIKFQAIIEAHLTGASWAIVAVLVMDPYGAQRLQLFELHSEAYTGYIDEINKRTKQFWSQVLSGTEPEIDYGRDAGTLMRATPHEDGQVIDLSHWNEGPSLVREYQALGAKISLSEDRRKAIKAEAFHKMNGASAATFNGLEFITVKTVTRSDRTVKGSSYQDVRFKGIKEYVRD